MHSPTPGSSLESPASLQTRLISPPGPGQPTAERPYPPTPRGAAAPPPPLQSFHEPLEHVRRSPLGRLLLTLTAAPHLRGSPHRHLVADLRHPIHQPVPVARRLHAAQRRPRQLSIETFCVVRGLRQLRLPRLS